MKTVTITRLGHHGDGIADGPIYAARTLPGETVSGELDGTRLTDIRIDTPSDARVKPPCAHYQACGGCALQHARDDLVAGFKQSIVKQALAAQGIEPVFRDIHTSPERSRRRASFAARRTKKGAQIGFYARASHTIADAPNCMLVTDDVLKSREGILALTLAGGSRKGELSVAVTATEAGLDLAVTGGKPLDGPLRVTLAGLAAAHDLARLSWDDETIVTRRNPVLRFGAAMVTPPPGAFLQATAEGEAALVTAVQEAVADARHIVDLFAGCGTFALPLAEQAAVDAVEGDRAMLAALDHGWRHTQGLKRVKTQARDLFRNPLLAEELGRYDAAVIDPPRAGAEAQTRALAASGVPRIASVSCNPTTFARDAKLLIQAGYRLDWVQVVDQFRWSPHVELAACFSLTHMAANGPKGALTP